MREETDPFENAELNRLQLFIYYVPVLGCISALWTIARSQGNRQQRAASRLAVLLALAWVGGHAVLEAGARSSESYAFPLLLTSSLLTSGYFLINFWLMVRLWQRKSTRLPGVSHLSDRVL
ncbi:hypothetical protein H6G20_02225 [Desertifilum sp. FACHB-1129]|uniref:Uncharacterized protein n=1 Tax=Desertifilum tharense IPPAS B-1220 TaxID=1781255 RepID=A0A1E5QDZ0_9CYAN|nr:MULTISPECIES: hypothetical protein [Desertifilum]MDA0209009.1 hypothetical protein [Cyanobacteria bacterium FC1]MBD2310491.1 hypothetical protein [Desertifilum sp. FACHB-1129]MBD2321943.1 hypothetical protein [Desertifilum sp. FACHB-866]MBD2332070.1 hypothetical protein [Desertifilum sp. FACHB-868]OEJ72804.1 hypothetical protein BH720_22785 [Desertifilum tharense IPPAS B-1220]